MAKLDHLYAHARAYDEMPVTGNEEGRIALGRDFSELMNEAKTAHAPQLNRAIGKLRMLGFHDCADALLQFQTESAIFINAILTLIGNGGLEQSNTAFMSLLTNANEFRARMERRYAQL
jgi:hypothetical protein